MLFQNNIPQKTSAIIFGCEGKYLNADEAAFFKEVLPTGFILFARNIDNADQVKSLINSLRNCVGWHCPILIDQEGGKVERLKAPHWLSHPAAQIFGELFSTDHDKAFEALKLQTQSIAHMLWELGITVNCSPVLDVPVKDAHDIIGNRAFSDQPEEVASLGQCVADTYLASAVTPVIKHIPGHGRARSDSHEALPVVETDIETLTKTDFYPFSKVNNKAYWGMTAHVTYTAIDAEKPATLSKTIIEKTIRKDIGFDGFLVGDDVFMKALDSFGDLEHRVKDSIAVGIDAALFCHGSVDDMSQGAKGAGTLRKDSLERLIHAETQRRSAESSMNEMNVSEIRSQLRKYA